MPISPITEIIDELRRGRMVVLMDDEDRENEGDLVMVAEHARPEDINFMAKHGRGLICLTLTQAKCRQLQLPLMVTETHQRQSTNFTVSIEAADGVTTGISAADRATTIQAAVRKDARPENITQPGHVFPLMAQRGGVLSRAGHTEAGVDLARLAGAEEASVICEIMNDDGTMARLPELENFAAEHSLKIGTIADLIRYRMENESTVVRENEYSIPTESGEFRAITYHDGITDAVHMALVKGEIESGKPVLVRVHVQETLLDAFTDAHRSGSWTLHEAMTRVSQEGTGVVVVLDQRALAPDLDIVMERFQDKAEQKMHQPVSLKGRREEMRTYGVGSQILADLGVTKMRVMGHAIRTPAMSGFGLETVEYLETSSDRINKLTKKQTG
ncbi:MAG: bifunctional 3,4-dihydroxy-2-butanone-4-phosphate synthase/GTP cyclohydrolase II [Gammaproteobacteria bacterium]|nr:bifunctional 3,4-dihydroxy-2-butanone-4-phosphate synthase/GTP cyclohydrolase II [Gammaproteobacteria bacterium]